MSLHRASSPPSSLATVPRRGEVAPHPGPHPAIPLVGASDLPLESLVTEVLEVLLEHDELGEAVVPAALVSRLPVPAEQVHAALDRLDADGETLATDRGLTLSETGRQRAVKAVRRHRLTERLLADVIGLEWWKVHHEAARWEGIMSDDVEERLLDLLGDPGTCPHGNPIPGSGNRPEHADAVRLEGAPPGPVEVLRITETLEGDDEALQLLQNCGFVPGRWAEVKEHRDGWVLVAGSIRDAAIPPHVAFHTYVAPR